MLRHQNFGTTGHRHVTKAICPARDLTSHHRVLTGVEQRGTDEVSLSQRSGEGCVDSGEDTLPSIPTAESVAKRVHGHPSRKYLAASDQTILRPGQDQQIDRHLHARSLDAHHRRGEPASCPPVYNANGCCWLWTEERHAPSSLTWVRNHDPCEVCGADEMIDVRYAALWRSIFHNDHWADAAKAQRSVQGCPKSTTIIVRRRKLHNDHRADQLPSLSGTGTMFSYSVTPARWRAATYPKVIAGPMLMPPEG